MKTDLETLIHLYETLTPESVASLVERYAPDARFRDPFNDVCGRQAVARVFSHMFRQVAEPRFHVLDQFHGADGVMLLWRFEFRLRLGARKPQSLQGVSHLRFDEAGWVREHVDYWDAAGELYSRLPILGGLMRCLQKGLAAR